MAGNRLIVAVGISSAAALVCWRLWRSRRDEPRLVEHSESADLLSGSQENTDDGLELGGGVAVVIRPTKFRRYVVSLLKAQHGILSRSEANRLMIDKSCRDIMRDLGVRPTQICLHAPIVTAMAFIPTNAELEAVALLGSNEALLRDDLATCGEVLAAKGPFRRWLNWLWAAPICNSPLRFTK